MAKRNGSEATSGGKAGGQTDWLTALAETPMWAREAAMSDGEEARATWLRNSRFEKMPRWPGVVRLVCKSAPAAEFVLSNFKAAAMAEGRKQFRDMEQLVVMPEGCSDRSIPRWCYASGLEPKRLTNREAVNRELDMMSGSGMAKRSSAVTARWVED